ncbi:MAG: polysaccharide deacetylase family protein [Deltaproteobacteria bacterium HGW-Deltaproteobacteria-5]|nr:MAG: polysaccharide deacetylase family protein [Deltaproteobacteria bacterium HGW-Deltaproteobacteria-5]
MVFKKTMVMKDRKAALSPAHITGIVLMVAAVAAFFVQPLLSAALLLFYVVLCVWACFYPQTNFLGPVISRGRSGEKKVAITFDDGPSEFTTIKILDLLDRYSLRATFFVSGLNATQYPGLINEIIRRGHSIGNHSMRHDPLVMLKSYRVLYREVYEAQAVLRKMGIEALAFRPPVGIINPKLPSILSRLGLFCVTFSCRAMDAGNFRVKNMAVRILKKLKGDDIILLHDKPPRRTEDHPVLFQEIENILTGILDRGFRVVPLAELIDREIMTLESRT